MLLFLCESASDDDDTRAVSSWTWSVAVPAPGAGFSISQHLLQGINRGLAASAAVEQVKLHEKPPFLILSFRLPRFGA